ncbi:Hypothetical predicted protein [Olea europaea subsp. europaea]|nr:Hypothetical predicted protein [Olea europaea subsp. europaea]
METVECGVAGVACGLWSADCEVWPVRSGRRSRADLQAAEASSKAGDRGRSKSQKKGQPANRQRRFVVDSGLTSRHSPSHRTVSLLTVTVERGVTNRRCHGGEPGEGNDGRS